MKFNKKKFQVVRNGTDEELKNNTTHFVGDYDEVIQKFSSVRDLGVQLTDDGTFNEHTENRMARQKSGWLLTAVQLYISMFPNNNIFSSVG